MTFEQSLFRALDGRIIQGVEINKDGVAGVKLLVAGGEFGEDDEEISVYFHGQYLGDLAIEIATSSKLDGAI